MPFETTTNASPGGAAFVPSVMSLENHAPPSSQSFDGQNQDVQSVFPCSNCGYPSVRPGCVCPVCGSESVQYYIPANPIVYCPSVDSEGPASVDCTLEDYQRVRDVKLRQVLDSPSALTVESCGRSLSWVHDRPEVRQDIKNGCYNVPLEQIHEDYLDWLDDSLVITLRNIATGERVRKESSKRGNHAYASHQRKRFSDIDRGIDALVNRQKHHPGSNTAMTDVLMVTYTHDPSIVLSEAEAWTEFTSRLNQWKVQAKRALGVGHLDVLCAREACGGDGPNQDYPAPHAIVILDHPIMAFRWVSRTGKRRGKETYRVNNDTIHKELKRIWPYGHLDIQAVVGGRVVVDGKEQSATQYILQYVTKSINIASDPKQTHIGIGVRTMSLSKLYHVQPATIGADLRRTLAEFVRLDSMLSTLQHTTPRFWRFESVLCCRSVDVIRHLVEHPPPDPRPYPIIGASQLSRPAIC